MGYESLCGLAKQLSHKGIGVEKRHYICRSGSNFDRFEPSVTNAHLNSIIKRSVLEAYMKCHAERDHFIWKILNGFLAELEESIIYQELNNASPSHPAVVTLKKVGEEACSIGLAPIEDMHLVSHMYDLLYNQNAKLVAVCAGSYHADSVSQVLEILGFTLEQKLGDVKQVKNLLDSSCFDLINNEMIPA